MTWAGAPDVPNCDLLETPRSVTVSLTIAITISSNFTGETHL